MRHRDETCASHMPVLMELVEIARPKRVLEFGCGYYSTRLFVDACEEVVSVEEDDAWAEEMRALYGARPNWRLAPGRGLPIALGALRDFGKADLVLIDGDVYRAEETNAALESAPLVVGHDTQGWQHDAPGVFLRDRYRVPLGVAQVDFEQFPVSYPGCAGCSDRPWTTLFARDPGVVAHFRDAEARLYEKYRFPYVHQRCPNPACGCMHKELR